MAKVSNLQINELIDQATSHVEDRLAGGKGVAHEGVEAHQMQASGGIAPAAIGPYVPRITSALVDMIVEAVGMAAIQNREWVVAHVGESTLKVIDETISVLRQAQDKSKAPPSAVATHPPTHAVAGDGAPPEV